MITQKESAFITHWEQVREAESRFSRKLLSGLPMALLFSLPILLSIGGVRLFMGEFDMRISKALQGSTIVVVLIAVLCIAFFFAYFRMHLRWEQNEQLYQSLKLRQNKEAETS